MRLKPILFYLALFGCLPANSAEQLDLPLNIPTAFVEILAGQALGLDASGRGSLAVDSCNRLEMRDLSMSSMEGELGLELGLIAHTGAAAFGRCAGPRPIEARLRTRLVPGLGDQGLTVSFTPDSMELLGADGRSGMLTTPSRVLADHLVIPLLGQMRIELAPSLEAVDETIESFLPADRERASRLTERARILSISVDDAGLALSVGLSITPLPPSPPEAVLDPDELIAWQRIEDELDGFLTVILSQLARQAEQRDLALGLLEVLIDSRIRIAKALASDAELDDPVRSLFIDSWRQLQPLLLELQAEAGPAELGLIAFISAGDALLALDALGPGYGLEFSRDGLRRLARALMAERAPLSFTPLSLDVDPELRALFGFAGESPMSRTVARRSTRTAWSWLIPMAHAETPSPAEALRGLVPRLAFLDDYLALVDRLLQYKVDARVGGGSRVPQEHLDLFDPLVRATAWKESCWRHYVGPADSPEVIRSPVGAVGMMQIMGRVWRSVYDVERLERDVDYNVAAGIEILEHYLVDYALRRGEHEQPGGIDNLVRATYAAYNGGPSQLSRYRREDTPARLRAIDAAFWRDFEQMRAEQWPDVASCYSIAD